MSIQPKVSLMGGGLGALSAAAAFMIRNGSLPGGKIPPLETASVTSASLDHAANSPGQHSLHGGRMRPPHNDELTRDLCKTIPALTHAGKTVLHETGELNEQHMSHLMTRLTEHRRANIPVTAMGFSMKDRIELLKFSNADDAVLGASCIIDWLSPGFFETEFWRMCTRLFAFQPWHSAVEFKHYLHRVIFEFSRTGLLASVK